ncbi:hypothetical protein GOEFS_115_00210 [Gordonia effusa NBRC 100432]|uniref:Uncharacterized protein n=1 Tax=Gordonia effusa NBRC 100432 TaxID=1077974 RepID=H0R5N0_9ACTN|nr:hypothetical protein [Gordonia effusa]GAB20381.1 hypothetical protein GOEFS_115_00210 [Gordonia effusa NBRC 100432]
MAHALRTLVKFAGRSTDVAFRLGGLGIAGTGVAHFTSPGLFRGVTAVAFPEDPERSVKINGATEAAIGSAIAFRPTRMAGCVALGVYGTYLAGNTWSALKPAASADSGSRSVEEL